MWQIDIVLENSDNKKLNTDFAQKIVKNPVLGHEDHALIHDYLFAVDTRSLAWVLHTFLMTSIDSELALAMQTSNDLRPFSIFSCVQKKNIIIRLSVYHKSAFPLIEIVQHMKTLNVSAEESGMIVLSHKEKPVTNIMQLSKPATGMFHIIFESPATYRHNKKPSNLYSLPPLLYPVAEKLHAFEDIIISKSEIDEMCDLVTYTQYIFKTIDYNLNTNITLPAFIGEMQITPGGSAEQREKLALLLRYSTYTGMGAKTALGMGGIILYEHSLVFHI